MESSELRAKVAEVAAPEGGWPALTSELVEVRFFLKQGHLDEAFELLSVLQRRYPGHPELADYNRPGAKIVADEQVGALVEDLLRSSASIAEQAVRRRATRWERPTAPGAGERTSVHEVVPPEPVQAKTRAAKLKLPKEPTRVYRVVAPKPPAGASKPPARAGMTVVVEALQPASPFDGLPAVAGELGAGELGTGESGAKAKAEPSKATATKSAAHKRARRTSSHRKARARRGDGFGAGVLSRFGR